MNITREELLSLSHTEMGTLIASVSAELLDRISMLLADFSDDRCIDIPDEYLPARFIIIDTDDIDQSDKYKCEE